jgi:hypothetical protein
MHALLIPKSPPNRVYFLDTYIDQSRLLISEVSLNNLIPERGADSIESLQHTAPRRLFVSVQPGLEQSSLELVFVATALYLYVYYV